MQIQFKTVLFDSEDFRFAVVNDSVLTIVTAKGELDVEFETQDDALDAQVELGQLLDAAKAPSVTDLLTEAASVVSGLFGGVFSTVKAKATTATGKATAAKSTVEERVQAMFDELEVAIKTVVSADKDSDSSGDKEPSSTATASTSAAAEANDVFGTSRAARDTTDTVVSELSDSALRAAIDAKAEHLIATDERVKAMIENISRFHSDAEVADAIESHKELVFNVARSNSHLTVNEVFAALLR